MNKSKTKASKPLKSEVNQALQKISQDEELTVAAITGTGKYFTSGNDMGDGMKRMMGKNSKKFSRKEKY